LTARRSRHPGPLGKCRASGSDGSIDFVGYIVLASCLVPLAIFGFKKAGEYFGKPKARARGKAK
jgi:hypothetical protein